jgi:hypothetical protein
MSFANVQAIKAIEFIVAGLFPGCCWAFVKINDFFAFSKLQKTGVIVYYKRVEWLELLPLAQKRRAATSDATSVTDATRPVADDGAEHMVQLRLVHCILLAVSEAVKPAQACRFSKGQTAPIFFDICTEKDLLHVK